MSVTMANPAIAPPRANEPVSPMNTSAGKALYQRNPIVPPIRAAASVARSRRASLRAPGSPERSHEMPAIARKVQQRDRRRPREQPVDPVREVRAVHRAGDDEEEERVVEDAEIEVQPATGM